MKHVWAVGCLGLSLAGMAAPAAAQMDTREGIALQNQVLELRRQLDQMRAQGGGGGQSYAPPPQPVPVYQPAPRGSAVSNDITAQLLDRVSQLEEDVRRLRGRNDELGNQLQQVSADLNKQISDLNFRLQSSDGGGGRGGASSGNVAAASPPPAPLRRTPEMALQEGNAALARRDYAAAEAAAKEVLNGRGPRSGDAQFLYAQALSGQRNYPAAAVAFNDSYERSHTGTRAQDSLLGLANALVSLNDTRAACDALNKLRTDFPSPRADLREPIASARGRAGCR